MRQIDGLDTRQAGAMPPRTPDGWRAKAEALAAGWRRSFGEDPTTAATVLALAVAEHETACGDAWPGEHNWGACQRPDGALTPEERQALDARGIRPDPRDKTCVLRAREVLASAGLDREEAALHVDTSPIHGPYFVYFFAFPDDAGGAALFVRVLVAERPSCRAALEAASVDHGSPQDIASALVRSCHDLAAAMYRTGYYEGFHNPKVAGGPEANVADYAHALVGHVPAILEAMVPTVADMDPETPRNTSPPTTAFNPSAKGVQVALKTIAAARHRPDFDPGPVDGIVGPRTAAAIQAFANWRGAVDMEFNLDAGELGPRLTEALAAELVGDGR